MHKHQGWLGVFNSQKIIMWLYEFWGWTLNEGILDMAATAFATELISLLVRTIFAAR